MRAAPVAALNLWVRAGSIDDPEGLSGIAHFVEHMLFKGSDGGSFVDIAQIVQGAGGYLNAQTGCDHTLYYQVVPADGWQEVLRAQAVAARSPVFGPDDVERERSVIVEEARSGENDPGTFLWRRLMETAYLEHPCRIPVVGTPETLSSVTPADLAAFHRLRYAPDNLVQVVVGDIDRNEVVERAHEFLETIPPGGAGTPPPEPEPPQRALRARNITGRLEQSYLAVAFHTPPVLDADIPPLDALCGLLGVGRSSRFRKSLQVTQGLVSDVGAFVSAQRDLGTLVVRAVVRSAADVDRTTEAIFQEIARLVSEPIAADEMEKNLRRLEASYVLEHETADSIAYTMGLFETFGDYRYASDYVDRLAAVSTDDVRRVAEAYLAPGNASVVTYTPAEADIPEGDRSQELAALLDRTSVRRAGVVREPAASWQPPGEFVRPMILAERADLCFARDTLPNGATLVVCESAALPICSVALGFRGGFAAEPDHELGSTYLTQKLLIRGTVSRSAEELADDIEGLGSGIVTAVDRDGFGLGSTVLSKHFGEAADILGEVITEPSLPVDQFELARAEVLAEVGEIEDRPIRRAHRLLLPLVFPDHPYGRPIRGERHTLASLTREGIDAWRRRCYTASNLVVCVAGDLPAGRVCDEFGRAFAGMEGGSERESSRGPLQPPGGRVDEEAPGVEQSTVVLGFRGPAVGEPDAVTARFLSRALSMMGGWLWQALRERPPYAYATGASYLPLRDGGAFLVHATTPPGQEEAAVETVLEEFGRLGGEGFGGDELELAKRYYAGTLEIAMQRGSTRAASFAMAEVVGVGYEHIRNMPDAVRRVTNDDVTDTAARYLARDSGFATVTLRPRSS
jgi:zinc protease